MTRLTRRLRSAVHERGTFSGAIFDSIFRDMGFGFGDIFQQIFGGALVDASKRERAEVKISHMI